MKRYIITKYVKADSIIEALKKEHKTQISHCVLEDTADPEEKPSLIGFDLSTDYSIYSPYLKRKKKK